MNKLHFRTEAESQVANRSPLITKQITLDEIDKSNIGFIDGNACPANT